MSLKEQLAARIHGRVAVLGIGNPERGDDGAGSLAARRIQSRSGVRVFDAQDVPENYLGPVVAARPDTVVLIDAVDLGGAPGSISILDKYHLAGYWPGTHRIPLCLLMNYLERETAADVFLVGIQPALLEFGRPMCDAVQRATAELAAVLEDIVADRWHEAEVAGTVVPSSGWWARVRLLLRCESGESKPAQPIPLVSNSL